MGPVDHLNDQFYIVEPPEKGRLDDGTEIKDFTLSTFLEEDVCCVTN